MTNVGTGLASLSPANTRWITDKNSITVLGYLMEKFCKKCNCVTDRLKSGDCRVCNKNRSSNRYASRAGTQEEKEARKKYYAENSERTKARVMAWKVENPEKKAAANKKWAKENPQKDRDSKRRYNDKNRVDILKKKSARAKANPELGRLYAHRRRSLKLNAGGKHTAKDIKQLFDLQRGKCACCNVSIKDKYHIDHVIPLAAGGSNDRLNLQLLCPTCNLSKSAKNPVDFMQQRGFLL